MPQLWDDGLTLLAATSPADQLALIVGAGGLLSLVIGIAFVAIARITRRRRAAFAAGAATASAEVVDNQWRNIGYTSEVSLLAFPMLRYPCRTAPSSSS